MNNFTVTVRTESGQLTFTLQSASSIDAFIEAADRFSSQPCGISVRLG
jgi:hypothetical protein